jgi:type VI secretion system protein ImpK
MTSATILPAAPALATSSTPTLNDLLEDGIYLLFLLRDRNAPNSTAEFNRRIDRFLGQFESNARNFGKTPEAVTDAKFAFCALLDEIILSSDFAIRDDWEIAPLQLRLFGQHLAGETFFSKLEDLRLNPEANVETLEVFLTCLLQGFQGRYLLEGQEKLNYLISRLTQEIEHVRGGKAEFAPHWRLPFKFQEFVRHELPLWLYFALLAIVCVVVFLGLHFMLGSQAGDLQARFAQPAAGVSGSSAPANATTPAARQAI